MPKKINFKKTLAIVSSLSVGTPAILTVIACGAAKVIENKVNLNTIIEDTFLDGNKFNTEKDVLNQIAKSNQIKIEDIEIKLDSFKPASEFVNGSAIIIPSSTSRKYTGEVEIIITAKDKILLETVLKNKEVASDTTEENIVERILKANPNSKVTKSDLELKSFNASDIAVAGLAILTSAENSKFIGEVEIIITAKDKILLETVLKNKTVNGFQSNDPESVLKEIIKLNSDSALLETDIEIKDFQAASVDGSGSAKIVATSTSKFTGEVDITIVMNWENEWDLNRYGNDANPRIWISRSDANTLLKEGKIDKYIWMLSIWTGIIDAGYDGNTGSYQESKYRFDNQEVNSYLHSDNINDVIHEFLTTNPDGGRLSANMAAKIDLKLTKSVVAKNVNNKNKLVEYKLNASETNFKKFTIVITG